MFMNKLGPFYCRVQISIVLTQRVGHHFCWLLLVHHGKLLIYYSQKVQKKKWILHVLSKEGSLQVKFLSMDSPLSTLKTSSLDIRHNWVQECSILVLSGILNPPKSQWGARSRPSLSTLSTELGGCRRPHFCTLFSCALLLGGVAVVLCLISPGTQSSALLNAQRRGRTVIPENGTLAQSDQIGF